MPIGLAHVTRNPRLAQTVAVVRRREIVNDFGEVSLATTLFAGVVGVVLPKSSQLVRDGDQQHSPKVITVHTPFRLRGPSPGYQPDLVRWHSNYYVVTSTNDFSDYGAGFISADCASIDFIDTPPPLIRFGQLDFSNPDNSGLIACCL